MNEEPISRRRWLASAAIATVGVGCMSATAPGDQLALARLSARPGKPTREITPGVYKLGLGAGRDGLLHVPASYNPSKPAPMVVMLHGAGSSSADVSLLPIDTNSAGVLLLVPDSRGSSWDIVRGTFGPDVAFIDAALRQTFSTCAVRDDRIALFGFSDGASYALSLGLANGDFFTHIAAFAPGFFAPPGQIGKPRIFLAHATDDPILPVEFSRSQLAPGLTNLGYDVTYLEVQGGHAVNQGERTASLKWFLA